MKSPRWFSFSVLVVFSTLLVIPPLTLQLSAFQPEDTFFSNVTDIAGVSGDDFGARAVCWSDYDNDGFSDLYVSSSYGENILYRNNGDGTFLDVTYAAGVSITAPSNGVAWGDYNNDSFLDLYVSNFGENTLFMNNGNGTFSDVTYDAGVENEGAGEAVTWVDYDNDGFLDIYVVNLDGWNVLYRNNGDGTFSDVSFTAGVDDAGTGENAAWADYDNDGYQDLYVSNRGENTLYHNEGDGTFTNVTTEAGVGDWGMGHGIAWGDYDRDGLLDLYLVNRQSPNLLYRNNGDGTFTDVAAEAGVDDDELYTVGTAFLDFDNDGDLDIYNVAGSVNRLFSNNGDGTFTDVTEDAGVGDYGMLGNGMACADYNNDGYQDIYVVNWSNGSVLFQNEMQDNNWIQLKLIGTTSNRAAIGARIELQTGRATQITEINGGSGFCSQNSMIAQFGVGESTLIDRIDIRWPSGAMTHLEGIEANQLLVVEEGAVPPSPLEISVVPDTTYYHKGELLGFTVTVTNTTDSPLFFQGWTEGETPWGLILSPLLGPVNAVLGPHQTISPHIAQRIPQNAVFGGPYLYRVKLGSYPDEVLAEDSFQFYIVPFMSGASGIGESY